MRFKGNCPKASGLQQLPNCVVRVKFHCSSTFISICINAMWESMPCVWYSLNLPYVLICVWSSRTSKFGRGTSKVSGGTSKCKSERGICGWTRWGILLLLIAYSVLYIVCFYLVCTSLSTKRYHLTGKIKNVRALIFWFHHIHTCVHFIFQMDACLPMCHHTFSFFL